MKIGTYLNGVEKRLFVQDGDTAIDLLQAEDRADFVDMISFIRGGDASKSAAEKILAARPPNACKPIEEIKLAEPLPPSTVLCAGSNYHAHNAEKASSPLSGREPEFFLKTSDCVIRPHAPILYDERLSQKLDCETELAIVIGRPGRFIAVEDALDHVFGYTISNDVTARDRQVRMTDDGIVFYELGRGKAFDAALPLGPVIATTAEIADPQKLSLFTEINGEPRQSASTSDMIWTCAELIHFFSINFTLRPGMVILTGTPAGTAWSVDAELGGKWQPTEGLVPASRYCLPGDTVTSAIKGIGVLENPVIQYQDNLNSP